MTKGRLAAAVPLALVLVSIANGLGPYLRRIGVVERERYDTFWDIHCGGQVTEARFLGVGRRCSTPNHAASLAELGRLEGPHIPYVFNVGPRELVVKGLKDLLAAVLVGAGFVAAVRQRLVRAVMRAAGPATILLGLVVLAALVASMRQGPSVAAAGLRSFSFLAVAFAAVALGLPDSLDRVARAVGWLFVVQALLLVPELLYGMPLYAELPLGQFPKRLAGTFVLPNALGVFAAVGAGFVLSFGSAGRGGRVRAFATALLLVGAAGSATGFLTLFVLAAAMALARVDARRRLALSAVLLLGAALLTSLLPVIVSRRNLFDSLLSDQGRLARLREAFRATPPELLLGQGLGVGSNASANLRPEEPAAAGGTVPPRAQLGSDSMVTLLLRETGLVGIVLFYAVLGWAWKNDRAGRLFYLAVAVASATMNLTESFPVNLLLGLALSHTFRQKAGASPSPPTGGAAVAATC